MITANEVMAEINKSDPASGAMLKMGGVLTVDPRAVWFHATEPLAEAWVEKAWKRLDDLTQEKFNLPFYRR